MALYAPETLSCDHCRYQGPPRPETLEHLQAAARVLGQSELRGPSARQRTSSITWLDSVDRTLRTDSLL